MDAQPGVDSVEIPEHLAILAQREKVAALLPADYSKPDILHVLYAGQSPSLGDIRVTCHSVLPSVPSIR